MDLHFGQLRMPSLLKPLLTNLNQVDFKQQWNCMQWLSRTTLGWRQWASPLVRHWRRHCGSLEIAGECSGMGFAESWACIHDKCCQGWCS